MEVLEMTEEQKEAMLNMSPDRPAIIFPNGKTLTIPNSFEINKAAVEGTEVVMKETDPAGKKPHEPGAKLDAGKAPIMQGVLQYFPRALMAVSHVSLVGAKKYAWKGWESVSDGFNRYSDALGRHLLAEEIDGPIDKDTQQLHAAQVAWNALARLELLLRESEDCEIPEKE